MALPPKEDGTFSLGLDPDEVKKRSTPSHTIRTADDGQVTLSNLSRSKSIPTSLRKYGEKFTLTAYVPGTAAIYQRVSPGGHLQFEIWKLRLDKDGNELPPSASQWGTYGWTFLTEERAWEKYRSLLQLAPSRGSEGPEEGGGPKDYAPAVYGAISSNQGGGGS
jgi:hypothetical protein